MRILSTLLKKLASKGFRGDSFKRKLYSFISKDSSSPSLSLICETSEVSSSQDMFGYLQKKKRSVHTIIVIHTSKKYISNQNLMGLLTRRIFQA